MDIERTLIWKAIQSGGFTEVVSRGIDAEHFADPDCREVYDYAMWFMREHKSPPSTKALKKEFPDFSAEVSTDPLSYHIEQFVLKCKERAAVDLVREYHDAIEDPDELPEIELRALEMARSLTEVVPAPRVSRFGADAPSRRREYDRRKDADDIKGIYMGLPTLDEKTLGIQPHEIAVAVAYMGVGKTTLMQHIAYSAYLQGKTVLFVSLEMEAEALLRKIDVMATNVRYHAMKALELDVGERETWERILDKAYEDHHERDIMIRDDINNCTADHVLAEMMRYKPDLVLVDYLELMSTPRGVSSSHWEGISHSGTALKQNARVHGVPHITAAQLTREGGKGDVSLATISYQSVGKHSDLVLALGQDEEKEARQEMDVMLLKNRDGPKGRATYRWELETMNIGEKGTEERFPARKSLIGKERRKEKKLEVARNVGGRTNPWGKRKRQNPWTQKGKSNGRPRTRRSAKQTA